MFRTCPYFFSWKGAEETAGLWSYCGLAGAEKAAVSAAHFAKHLRGFDLVHATSAPYLHLMHPSTS